MIPERRLHACRPGWEHILTDELTRTLSASRHIPLATGWTESWIADADAASEPSVAFAAQCLPQAQDVAVPSIAAGAREVAARIVGGLAEHAGPWRLHAFCVETPGSIVRTSRCELLEAAVRDLLRRRQRRLLRSLVTDPLAPLARDEWLVQCALLTPRRGCLSFAGPPTLHRLRHVASRFPGGIAPVAEDPRPPSRAYLKLLEAEAHLGRRIAAGERCVDLGASPGGWTWVALARGADVVAVDRSPLRADLMSNHGLTFRRGDAFKLRPADPPVDWLLCDVIAYPVRILDLLERWLGERLCRRFCVTVKFKGEADYPQLQRLKALLRAAGVEFLVRQLAHNQNEVTAMGAVPGR
jgi:23S rRNA (cytidine2498-2'-O)-methyltransferase